MVRKKNNKNELRKAVRKRDRDGVLKKLSKRKEAGKGNGKEHASMLRRSYSSNIYLDCFEGQT